MSKVTDKGNGVRTLPHVKSNWQGQLDEVLTSRQRWQTWTVWWGSYLTSKI